MRVPSMVLVLLLALGSAVRADVNPIYARLKAYRTYITIKSVQPQAHHFYVWFVDKDYCLCQISGNTVADMGALTEADLHLSWGAFGVPPEHVDPVPAEVKPLADAALARAAALHPDATQFKIQYAGSFRTVAVQELMPRALMGDPTKRPTGWVETTLKVLADGRVDGTYGMSMAAHGLLVHPAFLEEYTALPHFVNYVLPAELEGTSLLYGPIFGRSPQAQAAYEALCQRLVADADALAAGTYQNPIESVLTQQGETVLPPHYSTLLKISIQTYARAADFNHQLGESPAFVVSVRSGLAAPVTQTVTSEQTGLTYTLTTDLHALSIAMKISGPTGTVEATYPLRFSGDEGFVTEGDSAAMVGGWMFAEIPQEPHGLTLPGAGGFTSFDIYPESAIYGSLVSIPEGATMGGKALLTAQPRLGLRRALR